MGKIIFVNPPITPYERYGSLETVGDFVMPNGLCNLAAMTRCAGHETEIIDCEALGLNYEEAAQVITRSSPSCVGITAVTLAAYNAHKLAKLIKEMCPSTTLIIGGPHVTALPMDTMERFSEFDVGVIGEGDYTLVELLEAMDNKKNLRDVVGLVIRENGGVKQTGARPYIKNLDELPLPAWDMLPHIPTYYKVSELGQHRTPASALITSRGCPYPCGFCDRSVFGRTSRAYSAEYVLKMILHLYHRYGIRDIEVRDENLLVFRRRLIEICNLIKKEDLDLIWDCNARVDQVDPEILKIMKDAGCWQIAYGIESGSQRILDLLDKKITLEQIERALEWTEKAGIKSRGFFMIGNPTETAETVEETIKFALKLRLNTFNLSYFTPLPATKFYDTAEKYGSFDRDWKKLSLWTPVFIPCNLTKDELIRYRKKAVWKFYLRPRIIWEFLKMIRRPENVIKLLKGAYTFFRVLWE